MRWTNAKRERERKREASYEIHLRTCTLMQRCVLFTKAAALGMKRPLMMMMMVVLVSGGDAQVEAIKQNTNEP